MVGTSELIPKSNISYIAFAIFTFFLSDKILPELNCHPDSFGIYYTIFLMLHQTRFTIVHSDVKNEKSSSG